ncbi:MAG: DUF1311 domain-containing protein [Nitrosomonas sp.]|jgi:uncharacterized protein YecT (DUF1311 family)|nr:DUF1311 domain-containing protein [Nitrosomonas sp.]
MISRKSLIVGFVFCCFSQMSFADDVGITKQFSICMDTSGGITVDMINCIGEEAVRQDARINKAYKEIMASLSPARQKVLQTAQRAWIKYRDANCDFYADPDSGTMATLLANDCYMSSTATRAKELEKFNTDY